MPKKRRSGGRSKGGKGKSNLVQCSSCGGLIPRDKAKRSTRWVSLVDRQLGRELRSQGAILPRKRVTRYYCVSCAVHRRVVKVRSRDLRKGRN
ncbi:MAG: 30S ribosomal protein S26e [Candidatus Bathyarchaeota archaeon]|nr:MAG: 30S ribosomal protein S26e [Candidatus Bathyarchaeota archaeon]